MIRAWLGRLLLWLIEGEQVRRMRQRADARAKVPAPGPSAPRDRGGRPRRAEAM